MATKVGELSDLVGDLVRVQMNTATRRRNKQHKCRLAGSC